MNVVDRRLIVCVGPGGVGKTTIAAALAVESARRGRKVALVTIDPARRLANALGLRGLDDELSRVPLPYPGVLHAAMLETRSSWDALMRRIGAGAVVDNPVYQAFSQTLARSHAYVSMERLVNVLSSDEFDLVVLDTPPSKSALDILDAPDHLAKFLDDDAVYAFAGGRAKGKLSKLLAIPARAASRIFSMIASRRLAGELAGFLRELMTLRAGFRERARAASAALRDSATAFVLVLAPDETTVEAALSMKQELASRGIAVELVIANRAFVSEVRDPTRPVARADESDAPEPLRSELALLRARLCAENERRALALSSVDHVPLPDLDREPTSVEELAELASLLAKATGAF